MTTIHSHILNKSQMLVDLLSSVKGVLLKVPERHWPYRPSQKKKKNVFPPLTMCFQPNHALTHSYMTKSWKLNGLPLVFPFSLSKFYKPLPLNGACSRLIPFLVRGKLFLILCVVSSSSHKIPADCCAVAKQLMITSNPMPEEPVPLEEELAEGLRRQEVKNAESVA